MKKKMDWNLYKVKILYLSKFVRWLGMCYKYFNDVFHIGIVNCIYFFLMYERTCNDSSKCSKQNVIQLPLL